MNWYTNLKLAGGVMDFSVAPEWHDVFYGNPSPEKVRELGIWLRDHPNDFVRLYHGTAATHPIMEQGLLPTSGQRRNSMQSGAGFVYLSVYPGMAKDFATMAYPGKPVKVYAVEVTVRRLLPDTDQLRNQRLYAERNVSNTLANSLAFGHGARIKGAVEPFQIRPQQDDVTDAPGPASAS